MEIGLGIAELWVDKLGWGQIPFSQNYGEYDKHNQNWIFNHLFRFLQTCSSQTTTKQITPHQKNLNESVHTQQTHHVETTLCECGILVTLFSTWYQRGNHVIACLVYDLYNNMAK